MLLLLLLNYSVTYFKRNLCHGCSSTSDC